MESLGHETTFQLPGRLIRDFVALPSSESEADS